MQCKTGLELIADLKELEYVKGGLESKFTFRPFAYVPIKTGEASKGLEKTVAHLKCLIRYKPKEADEESDEYSESETEESVAAEGGTDDESEETDVSQKEMANIDERIDPLSHLIAPETIVCRVYVLRGIGLIPAEGADGTCDPYLTLVCPPFKIAIFYICHASFI